MTVPPLAESIDGIPYPEDWSRSIPRLCETIMEAPLTGELPARPVAPARAMPVARPYAAASAGMPIAACSCAEDAPAENADPAGDATGTPPAPVAKGEPAWIATFPVSGVTLTGDRGDAWLCGVAGAVEGYCGFAPKAAAAAAAAAAAVAACCWACMAA